MELHSTEVCKVCGGDTKVVDSRIEEGIRIRRRECLCCRERYTTIEIMQSDFEHLHVKASVESNKEEFGTHREERNVIIKNIIIQLNKLIKL